MKYAELLELQKFFRHFKKINALKRIDDNVLELNLDREKFIIDLNRNESGIYTANLKTKDYNAPFDFMLKKYFSNAEILSVEVTPNNRILSFHTKALKAYKSFETRIDFEFTGKNTNAIIIDDKGEIIEALRHIDKSYRIVKPGVVLEPLKPFKMDEKIVEILDFKTYFTQKFQTLYHKKLKLIKQAKLLSLEKKITKLDQLLKGLEKEEDLLLQAQNLSQKADVLLANLGNLKDYDRNFKLLDFEGKELEFKLESSPKESANLFYKQAKKQKQKAKNVSMQKENLKEKLDFLEHLKELINKTNDIFELEILSPKSKTKQTKKEDENSHIASFYFKDFKISVGKNEKGNEALLKQAKKDDLWFHVKDLPSSHVIVSSNKQKISEEVLEFAAKLCVNFSNLKQGSYLVDYTSRNFVKIKQKAFVNYTNFKSISISKE